MPKVSILIATYNRKNLLRRAIESVFRQSFSDWELIVVDDGSDDGTEEMMKEYAAREKRMRYIRRSHAGRIAVVSNRGLAVASGEYIAILDDDDYWIDERKLEKQVYFLDGNPAYVGCGGGVIAINEAGEEIFRFLKPSRDEEIRKKALYANPMANSTTVFRKNIAESIGFYDEKLTQFADWDFWLKLGTKGKLYNLPEYFVAYRMWNKGSSFINQKENARSALIIPKRYNKSYPGFLQALIIAYLYKIYVLLFPDSLRKLLNPIMSGYKKKIFSGQVLAS